MLQIARKLIFYTVTTVAVAGHLAPSPVLAAASVAVSAAPPAVGTGSDRLGVVIESSGAICMAVGAQPLRKDALVTLVVVDLSNGVQSIRGAFVDGPGVGCSPDMPAGQPLVRLRLRFGDLQDGAPAFGIIGTPSLLFVDQLVSGPLTEGGGPVSFQMCSAARGLHLTAWEQVKGKQVRIWHSYVDMHVDLDEDCESGEVS
jgi:hypothetical protein